MLLKATHNSCTAEKSKNILYWLMHPIAQCQRKTIKEQFEDGCTYFDLRVRKNNKGQYILCHGLWKSKRTLSDILQELTDLSRNVPYKVYVDIVYEGTFLSEEYREDFLEDIESYRKSYPNILFAYIIEKLPVWKEIKVYNSLSIFNDFTRITWQDKTAWFPIPYYWWKKRPKPVFNEVQYTRVDFL